MKLKGLRIILIVILLTVLYNFGLSQYQISLKIIVTRSDNGLPIHGATVELFGEYMGYYNTDSNGEIFFKKTMYLNQKHQSISSCTAMGYYPAPIYNYGYGPGAAVKIVTFTYNHPHHIVNILLEPASRYNMALKSPELQIPEDNINIYRGQDITFRWSTIQEAAYYEIQLSNNNNFSSLDFSFIMENISNHEYHQYQPGPIPGTGYYYWRVRASDGNKWSDWSEVRIIRIKY